MLPIFYIETTKRLITAPSPREANVELPRHSQVNKTQRIETASFKTRAHLGHIIALMDVKTMLRTLLPRRQTRRRRLQLPRHGRQMRSSLAKEGERGAPLPRKASAELPRNGRRARSHLGQLGSQHIGPQAADDVSQHGGGLFHPRSQGKVSR